MAKLKYGIIGHLVAHSLSPAMQNAAFAKLGIDAGYELFDIEPSALEDFLSGMPEKKISGVNITIPHKIRAKEYIQENGSLDENAKKLGAVNTVKVSEGKGLCGYNTDGPGFYRSLVEDLRFEPEGRRIFMFGAGGAATAVVMYLGNGPRTIYVSDIDKARLLGLKKHYAGYYEDEKLVIVDEKNIAEALAESDLLVNATPVGMKADDASPVDKKLLKPGLRVYDLVYNKPVTQLVKEAQSLKLHAVTGVGMLLYQGVIAFEIWTGRSAPVDTMRKALKEALKG